MPGYIARLLKKYGHPTPSKPQHCPYAPAPKQYGSTTQEPIPEDKSPHLDEKRKKRIQQVVVSALYYARAIDLTMLMDLTGISQEQANPTAAMEQRIQQLLDYCATLP